MDTRELIDALNRDLASEYGAIIQYIQYSAKVTGANRQELRQFFQGEIADEQMHAQYLADKVVTLGGEPATQPTEVPRADTPEAMLRAILEAEEEAIRQYNERIRHADSAGDTALRVHLENMVSDETKHRDEVRLMLANWR